MAVGGSCSCRPCISRGGIQPSVVGECAPRLTSTPRWLDWRCVLATYGRRGPGHAMAGAYDVASFRMPTARGGGKAACGF